MKLEQLPNKSINMRLNMRDSHSEEQFWHINYRYSCKHLIPGVAIFHCLLRSPGPNYTFIPRHIYKYLLYRAGSLINAAVNENDQANKYFNYMRIKISSCISTYPN